MPIERLNSPMRKHHAHDRQNTTTATRRPLQAMASGDEHSGDAIIDGARASGRLTAVNGTVATGQVTDSTAPSLTPIGPITMTLNPSTDSIETSGTSFCGDDAPGGTCGA
jgi:hypothetical protein